MQTKRRSKHNKTNQRKTTGIYLIWESITLRTPTRKKNIIICFIFIGKTESTVYKSDENRAKIRPEGVVSKNCCDTFKILFSKLWCRIAAAFNDPYAKTIGPIMIAITVGFMPSEFDTHERERERERRKIYGFNGKRQTAIQQFKKCLVFLRIFYFSQIAFKNELGKH